VGLLAIVPSATAVKLRVTSAVPATDSGPTARPSLFWLFLPFALSYGGSYFLRNVNAVAGPLLAQEFGLGAGGLGFLTSAYFLAFSLAQIPLGIALDRFGHALVNAVMLTTVGLGATIFACADSMPMLLLGRCLIGVGAGAALMSSMSAVHAWAGRERAATYTGLIMLLGGAGAMLAGSPTQWLVDQLGWRAVILMLAAFSCAVAALTLTTARHVRPVAAGQSLRQLMDGVGAIYVDRQFWQVCIPMMLTVGAMLAFQSLWTATWMRDVAGFTARFAIGNVLVAGNLGMTLAFVSSGWIADRLRARGIAYVTTLKAYMLLAIAAQAWLMAAPASWPHVAWGLFGYGANALLIGYALLATRFPPELTGRVNTSVNLMIFSCAFVLQWGIGLIVNLWPATARGYARDGYYAAWLPLLAVQVAIWVWLAMRTRGGHPDPARNKG
jgi:MFS family permease